MLTCCCRLQMDRGICRSRMWVIPPLSYGSCAVCVVCVVCREGSLSCSVWTLCSRNSCFCFCFRCCLALFNTLHSRGQESCTLSLDHKVNSEEERTRMEMEGVQLTEGQSRINGAWCSTRVGAPRWMGRALLRTKRFFFFLLFSVSFLFYFLLSFIHIVFYFFIKLIFLCLIFIYFI